MQGNPDPLVEGECYEEEGDELLGVDYNSLLMSLARAHQDLDNDLEDELKDIKKRLTVIERQQRKQN